MGKYLHQITELSETPANGDLVLIQDVSDTTDSANGTTKRISYSNLTSGLGGGSGLSNIVEDTTPQLGGALDVNGKSIVSTSGANITIAPNGTGNVLVGTMTFDADQSIGASQDNYVLTYDNSTGLVSLEAAAGGGIALTALSVGSEPSASGNGAIAYNNSTGVFTYTPPTAAGISAAAASHAHATSDITSGTFANARIAQSNVTQHQAALSITESQISNLGSYISNVLEDTTPQLGGHLDVNAKSIVSTSNGNITIAPNGVGNIILGTMTFNADQSIGAGQDNYVLTYDNSTGLVSFEAAAGGDITAVNITTDSGAGSKASDTSGDADFSLLGGDGISVTNSGATITVALADPDSDNGSDIDEGVIATSDRLLIWDETANSWKYVTVDNLQDELDTNTGIALTNLSVGAEPSASGNGAIAYNNSTGVFTYTPPTAAGISAITVSSTDTLTNKTFDANGTGNSLSNVETADLASGSKTGADAKVVTGTEGTNGNLVSWNADGDAVDSSIVASNVALSNGDTYTGTHDFGGATLEIPNAAAPSMSVAGQIALDTTTTDHTALLKYHDGSNEFVIPAILTSGLSTTDNDVIAYNAANNRFQMEAQTGSGGISNVVEDTTPQLGGPLDVNGKAIGDGTRELLTFTEDGSAVNHVNIENQATGGGPIISSTGDDTNVDLILSTKGSGNVGINTAAPNAKLSVNGSMSLPIEAISATDTLDDTNHTVLVNAAGGVKTVNLPAASGATGKTFIIKKTDSSSNNVTIDPNASETIDGSSTFAFNAQYRAVTIQCDGTNWHIISSYILNY